MKKKRQRKSTPFFRGLPNFSTLYEKVKMNNEQNETKFEFSVGRCTPVTTLMTFFNPNSSFFLIASLQEVSKQGRRKRT